MNDLRAPFPYFGGKGRAAKIVWEALGDPSGFIEPFCGSAAVLLQRPVVKGRRVETINDLDGWLVNAWRSIQLAPKKVAQHALGPVTEIDYHARLAWLQERRPDFVAWLEGHPQHHDAKAAGWWLYVMACGIGDPFGGGPWQIIDGHLRKADPREGVNREIFHLTSAGQGIHRALPHLGDAGRGIHRALPHLAAGRGILAERGVQLEAYLTTLADRLARVRITCGPWDRVMGPAVTRAGTGGDGSRAIFLDPPYSTSGDLYMHGSLEVGHQVREWCMHESDNDMRIVLCGYDTEHDELLQRGWTVAEGKSGSGSGYSTNAANGRRERLWMSPACIPLGQQTLFEEGEFVYDNEATGV